MASPETPVAITCKYCLNEQVRTCLKCKSHFCVLHAAKFSPNFCKDCLTNISAIMNTINRTSVEYDMVNDELIPKVVPSRTLQIDGPDWVFMEAWMDKLPEEDWQEVYLFTYFVLKYMEYENEIRKVKQTRRIALSVIGVKPTPVPKPKKQMTGPEMQLAFEKMGIDIPTIKVMMMAAGFQYKEHPSNGNNG